MAVQKPLGPAVYVTVGLVMSFLGAVFLAIDSETAFMAAVLWTGGGMMVFFGLVAAAVRYGIALAEWDRHRV